MMQQRTADRQAKQTVDPNPANLGSIRAQLTNAGEESE